jgi:hypothetical protein
VAQVLDLFFVCQIVVHTILRPAMSGLFYADAGAWRSASTQSSTVTSR